MPSVGSKISKSKKKPSGCGVWVQKNKAGTAFLSLLLLFALYLIFFEKPKTPEQAKLEENVMATRDRFVSKGSEVRKEATSALRQDVRDKLAPVWKSFTRWQRKSTIQEVVTFMANKDLPDHVGDFLKAPDMKFLMRAAMPELSEDELQENDSRLWALLDAYNYGTHNTDASLGEDSTEAWQTTLKSDFWGGMDIFDDEDRAYLNLISWEGIREVVLGRFFFVFASTANFKALQLEQGKTLDWPEEPEPEPAWIDEDPTAEDVVHMTDLSFAEDVKRKKHTLVMFYAPWCGHCKAFKPHVAKVATALKDRDDVALAGLDCTRDKKTCRKFKVKGYPTILYFMDGEQVGDYDGGRDAYGVLSWLDSQERLNGALGDIVDEHKPPPEPTWQDEDPKAANVIHITDESFDADIKSKKHMLVMFYAPWCGHCKSFKPHVSTAAEALKDNADVGLGGVDCTLHKAACEKFDVKGFPTTLYFKDGEKVADYDGKRDAYGVLSWLDDPTRLAGSLTDVAEGLKPPPEIEWKDEDGAQDVVHLTDATFAAELAKKTHGLVMFYAPWCGHCKAFKPAYASTATALKDNDVVIGAIDATKDNKEATKYEVKGFPTVIYFRDGQKVETYNAGRTQAEVVAWLNDPNRMNGALGDGANQEEKDL